MRTYLIAMAVRTVSFPLAVWALLSGWVVPGLILAAAATFLPQIAVTIANVADNRTTGTGTVTSPTQALPPGPGVQHPPGETPHGPSQGQAQQSDERPEHGQDTQDTQGQQDGQDTQDEQGQGHDAGL